MFLIINGVPTWLACWCNGYGVRLAVERSRVRFPAVPPSGNDSGQVVHTHTCVPLSPSSIIWYRSKRREGNGSMWERCGLLPSAHVTELCQQLTASSVPCKRRWAPTLRSQSCERVILTMGNFTRFYQLDWHIGYVNNCEWMYLWSLRSRQGCDAAANTSGVWTVLHQQYSFSYS